MLRCLPIVFLFSFVAGCGSDIVRDSAELDRALVPAIDLTRHEELAPARAAMSELLPAWEDFRARHQGYRPDESFWAAALAEIDTLLSDVADLVEDGEDLTFAAANLVDMRMMLAELREAAGIEYYPDRLAELWEAVEEIDDLARRRDEDNVTPGDILALSALLEEFDDALQEVVEARFEPGRYGFDAVLTEELYIRLDALADASAGLDTTLAGDNPAEVLRRARSLLPLYFEVYRLFGDYNLGVEPGPDEQ